MRERPQQSYLGKIALIAWREFRHTALTKGFIFGAVALPVIMFGVIAASGLFPMAREHYEATIGTGGSSAASSLSSRSRPCACTKSSARSSASRLSQPLVS